MKGECCAMNPTRFLLGRLRYLRQAVRERPVRLLAIALLVVGSLPVLHCGAVLLIDAIFFGVSWAHDWEPSFLLIPALVGAGVGLVRLGLHLWQPGRKVGSHFLKWLALGVIAYAIGFVIWLSLFVRPQPPTP